MKNPKHLKPKENKSKKKFFIIPLIIVLIIVCFIIWKLPKNNFKETFKLKSSKSIKGESTVEGEKLVFKSTSAFNKIMEFTFENNILKTVKIYEQFENDEQFEYQKDQYKDREGLKIININEEDKSIEIEKTDLTPDEGKSYEEIYNKYIVQIVGAYEVIE